MSVRPAKTQISLGIRPVWSDSSLCAHWVARYPSFLHADSEDSDQTGRLPRLIWVFARCTLILLVLSWGGSNVFMENWQKLSFSYLQIPSLSVLLVSAIFSGIRMVGYFNRVWTKDGIYRQPVIIWFKRSSLLFYQLLFKLSWCFLYYI